MERWLGFAHHARLIQQVGDRDDDREQSEVVIEAETKLKENHIDEIIASGTDEIVLYKKDITDKTAGDIGRELMKSTKKDITKLKKVLGNEHFSYSLYADKLASQLEQCGVAYYNQTANDLDYIDVYKYALLLAEGDRIKNKLKEALKHSNNEKKAEGVDVISDKLKAYVERHQKSKFTGNIDAAEKLLKECIPILKIIKTNRGGEDELRVLKKNNVYTPKLGCQFFLLKEDQCIFLKEQRIRLSVITKPMEKRAASE